MYLYELIEKYGKGANPDKMKELTHILSDFLVPMKEAHKDKYWSLMRKIYGLLSDGHYCEEFALHDVAEMEYTDRQGEKRKGAYWTLEQIKEATKEYKFPASVNEWDLFVAFNGMHSDLCKKLDDKQVMDAAYSFFFADEDWKVKSGKVWRYFECKYADE